MFTGKSKYSSSVPGCAPASSSRGRTNPSYSAYATQQGADLDLEVVDAAGTVAASSYTWDDSYDIAAFTPTVAGTYHLEVYKNRCSYNPQYVGWAWYQGT